MSRPADAVVVGGGVIGCAVARALARRGARAVVLERARVGGEATGAAAGMVAPQAECEGPGPVLALGLESRRRWAGWAAALREESGIDVEYRKAGVVYVALGAADVRVLAARARWQRRLGLRVERLALADLRRRVPVVSRDAVAAFHFPDDHRVNNERLALATALAARRAGARILEGTAARALVVRRGRVEGVDATSGRIVAPVVVNAAGAWAPDLALPPGMRPPPVFPVRGQIVVLRAPSRMLGRPLYSRRGYVVPRLDGRLLAGSTLERVGYEKRVTAGGVADILAAVCALAPGLASAAVESAHAGLRPGTPDRRPLLGPAAEPRGLFYAAGHYRSGILLAPATGEAIADLILAGRTALPVGGMEPDRFG